MKLLESITSYKIIIWTGGDINIDHNNIVVRNKVLSNLKRILNMDEMNYHPMRKEYALEDGTREDKDDKMFGR